MQLKYYIFLLIPFFFNIKSTLKAQCGSRYYPDTSNLIWSGKTKNGLRNGTWKGFDKSQKLIVKAKYSKGKLNGEWKEYFVSEKLKTSGKYILNNSDGIWITYFENGEINCKCGYSSGKLNGSSFIYNLNGIRITESYYKNGKRDSIYRIMDDNGILYSEEFYHRGKLTGTSRKFNPKTGILIEADYYGSDTIADSAIENWNSGQLRSRLICDKSGNLEICYKYSESEKLVCVLNYKTLNGKQSYSPSSGFQSNFIPGTDTLLSSGEIILDEKEGPWCYYNKNGRLEKKLTFQYGKLNGSCFWYYPNGKSKAEGTAKNSKLNNNVKIYSEDGVQLQRGNSQYEFIYYTLFKTTPELDFNSYSQPLSFEEQDSSSKYFVPKVYETAIEMMPEEYENGIDQIDPDSEIAARMKGDKNAFEEYIHKNQKYPADAKKKKIEGIINLTFVVDSKGNIANVKVTKGVDAAPSLGLEAVRLISSMPPWDPEIKNGMPIEVTEFVQIEFKLPK
jgi:TonB family protein